MRKHTKGEWKVRFMGEEDTGENDFFVEAPNPSMPYGIEIMGDDYGDHICYSRAQRLADAKLIASAPDMLEALQEITSQFEKIDPIYYKDQEIINKALAAIKKATE